MKSQPPSFLAQAAQGRKAQTHPPTPADREIPTPLLANEARLTGPMLYSKLNQFFFASDIFAFTILFSLLTKVLDILQSPSHK